MKTLCANMITHLQLTLVERFWKGFLYVLYLPLLRKIAGSLSYLTAERCRDHLVKISHYSEQPSETQDVLWFDGDKRALHSCPASLCEKPWNLFPNLSLTLSFFLLPLPPMLLKMMDWNFPFSSDTHLWSRTLKLV